MNRTRIKKWYCPQCQTFKSFCRTIIGFMGYPDEHVCRCCGHKLIDARGTLRCRDILAIIKAGGEMQE